MYKNNYRTRSRGHVHARTRRPAKRGGAETIDPARFIKVANPAPASGYKPKHQFDDFDMHPLLKINVLSKGYSSPSEIQDKTISLGIEGKNVIGIANTGTGKTAAFALPILNNLMRTPGTRALIVAPTRELAIQIEEQFILLAKNSGFNTALLIGGMPMGRQLKDLRGGARAVIGTPGRIKDHLGKRSLFLDKCTMVVLDEVDRMLDMGFINDVREILSQLPERHQSFFFSATLSPNIKTLIDTFVSNPVVIDVKIGETSQNIHQDVVRYQGSSGKIDNLHEVLIRPNVAKTLVFGRTKYSVDRLARELKARGFKAESIHGGKSQGQRKRALGNFKDDQTNVLVATDVAARGIDVKDITHVINYDQPATYDDYVHRIGRAGRAGRPGYALTFVENK